MNKVPEVTLCFWLVKIMATTVGETAADFLDVNLHFGLTGTSILTGILLAFVLLVQIKSKKYVPWMYWIAVVLVSIFGTLLTDNMVDHFDVKLEAATAAFTLALSAAFTVWYFNERTLSVHTIVTVKREIFYWIAILFTFALGTAAGDWVSEGLELGYASSLLIYAGLIALVAFGHYLLKVNATLSFWLAYVLTRPLGASLGDLLSQDHEQGGLGFGTTWTSFSFLFVIFGLVAFMAFSPSKPSNEKS